MDTVKIKVDGVALEGTPAELAKFLTKLGLSASGQLDTFYYSESKKEYIKYSDLNIVHAFNAFMKLYDDFLLSLREKVRDGTLTPQKALAELTSFPSVAWFANAKTAERLATEIFGRS